MQEHTELHFIPESAKSLGVVDSIKDIVNS